MREPKYHIALDGNERRIVIDSLNNLRNKLDCRRQIHRCH